MVLMALCLVVYANSLGNGFVWDDHALVRGDPWVHRLDRISYLASPSYWIHSFPGIKGQYRPMRAITFAFQWTLWGADPLPYHLFNLLVHMANVLLIYRVMGILLGKRELAWLAAAIFAVHPANAEAVVWVKNRSELMVVSFVLLSMWASLKGLMAKRDPKGTIPWVLASSLSFALALMSKENAIVYPLLFLLVGLIFKERRGAVLAWSVPLFVLSAAFSAFKVFLLRGLESPESISINWVAHLLLVLRTLGEYLLILVWPWELNVDRGMDLALPLQHPDAWMPMIPVALAALSLLFLALRRQWVPLFGGLWVFISLAPVSNIVVLSTRPLAEQRLYIPSIGFSLCLAWALKRLGWALGRSPLKGRARGIMVCFVVLLVGLFVFRATSRVLNWRDDLTLVQDTLRKSPNTPRVHLQMGILHLERGQLENALRELKTAYELSPDYPRIPYLMGMAYERLGDHAKALQWFQRTVELSPRSIDAIVQKAISQAELGRLEEAEETLSAALKMVPDDPYVLRAMGIIYGKKGQFSKAVEVFERLLEWYPGDIHALRHLAYAYASIGRVDRSIQLFLDAVSLAPGNVQTYLDLARAYRIKGDLQEALRTLQDALDLAPNDPRVHNRIGDLLASLKRYDEAIDHFRRVVELVPHRALAHYNLARACMDAQRFRQAEDALRKAIELAPRNPLYHRTLAKVLAATGRQKEASKERAEADSLERASSPR